MEITQRVQGVFNLILEDYIYFLNYRFEPEATGSWIEYQRKTMSAIEQLINSLNSLLLNDKYHTEDSFKLIAHKDGCLMTTETRAENDPFVIDYIASVKKREYIIFDIDTTRDDYCTETNAVFSRINYKNIGNGNSGYYNIGNNNRGNFNAGDKNQGEYNVGHFNEGDYNVGSYNLSDYNVGFFNTENHDAMFFDKPSNKSFGEFTSSAANMLINNLFEMPQKNRQDYWNKYLIDEEKMIIKSIPNFDPEKFKRITGVDVGQNI